MVSPRTMYRPSTTFSTPSVGENTRSVASARMMEMPVS